MSDEKKCKKCGACTECGASPQVVPMPYPVYPFGTYPQPRYLSWRSPYYYSNVAANQSTGGLQQYATTNGQSFS